MQINKFGFYIWRHSLRKINEFPFYNCSNRESVRELTLNSLKKEEIALWMDKLLKRKEGYHSHLLERVNISNVAKKIDYITQILISSVIKNDIGLRGGISPLFDNTGFNVHMQKSQENLYELSKLPSKAIFVDTDMDNFNPFSLIEIRNEPDDYIIPYSIHSHSVDITCILEDKIRLSSQTIINKITEEEKLSDCVLIAIDFFICNNDAIPFECHFPGRGIGVHLLPFLFSKDTANLTQNVIINMREHIRNYYGVDVSMKTRNSYMTIFHELDEIAISLLSNYDSRIEKTIDLDVKGCLDDFHMRDLEIKNEEINQMIIRSPINNYDLEKIECLLGKWVVLKTRKNIPWWSKFRKRPEILIVDDKLILRVNNLLKIYGELILQKLVNNSIDVGGHFGELRAYYLLMR